MISSAFKVNTPSGFNTNANALQQRGQQQGQQQGMAQNQATIGVYTTRFGNLQPHQQEALRKIETEFRKPMKDHLREIGTADTKHYDLQNKLVEMKVDTMKLLNEQNELKGKMAKLLEHTKYSYSDCEGHGEQQMQRIAKRQEHRAYGNLPNAYFRNHLTFLVDRLSDVATKIESFDKLMHSVRRSLSSRIEENKLNSVSTGGLERRRYVGTKDIQKMMKLQNDAFNSLSTTIAELHQEAGDIRRSYLAKKREEHPNEIIQNPFDAEDKKQQTEEEYRSHLIQKEISENYKHQNYGNNMNRQGMPGQTSMQPQAVGNVVPGTIIGAGGSTIGGANTGFKTTGFNIGGTKPTTFGSPGATTGAAPTSGFTTNAAPKTTFGATTGGGAPPAFGFPAGGATNKVPGTPASTTTPSSTFGVGATTGAPTKPANVFGFNADTNKGTTGSGTLPTTSFGKAGGTSFKGFTTQTQQAGGAALPVGSEARKSGFGVPNTTPTSGGGSFPKFAFGKK